MTKTRPRQLELPVLVDVNERAQSGTSGGQLVQPLSRSLSVDTGFHKPASAEDQAVYKAIRDRYFNATTKRA
ncbi:hypothetical protein FACS1894116_04020 [Betaproteobacteria bacterium]|nr:hypothetical protein FACS1894116_04020 [Betaproteobacteria bacterium]GHU22563.1 hypothetical protein FACS189488_03370 [Betaproteobacteria bacterium]